MASDGVLGLYRGFGPSVLGIVVYRGLYFGMYDSIKPVLLVGPLEGNFLASFLLGWSVTTGAGIASYPLDTIRRRMMMTSGEVRPPDSAGFLLFVLLTSCSRLSSTSRLSTLVAKSLQLKVSDLCSKVQVPTSCVVLPELVCFPYMIKFNYSSSEKHSKVDLVKRSKAASSASNLTR